MRVPYRPPPTPPCRSLAGGLGLADIPPGAAVAAAGPLRRKVSAAPALVRGGPSCRLCPAAQPRTALAVLGLNSSGLKFPRVRSGGLKSKELYKAPPGRFPSYGLHNGDSWGNAFRIIL